MIRFVCRCCFFLPKRLPEKADIHGTLFALLHSGFASAPSMQVTCNNKNGMFNPAIKEDQLGMMNKKFKMTLVFCLLATVCVLSAQSSHAGVLPKSLVGVYQIEEMGFYRDLVRIRYLRGTFVIQEYQSGKWSEPEEVHPVSKPEFENLLREPVTYTFKGLANESVALFKVPKGWSYGNFTCNTRYWLMTLVGPVEIIKK